MLSNGITATKYCSKVNEELNDYLIKEFNHRMPLSSPVSVFFNNRDVFTFNPENNLDKDMWQLITSFEGDFNTKELTEMLVKNGYDISLENLCKRYNLPYKQFQMINSFEGYLNGLWKTDFEVKPVASSTISAKDIPSTKSI